MHHYNSVVVTQPDPIVMVVNVTSTTATVVASGGTGTLMYNRTGATTFVTSPNFTGLTPNTSYIFKTRDANGCEKSAIKKTNASGYAPPSTDRHVWVSMNSQKMLVYPNPASDWVNIMWAVDDEPSVAGRVQLIDALGRIVFENELYIESGAAAQIPVHQFSAGTYFLIVNKSDNTTESARLVIFRD